MAARLLAASYQRGSQVHLIKAFANLSLQIGCKTADARNICAKPADIADQVESAYQVRQSRKCSCLKNDSRITSVFWSLAAIASNAEGVQLHSPASWRFATHAG